MGILGTVRETLEASTESANRGGGKGDGSKGAYWCHDCVERIRDVDVEEGSPSCPDVARRWTSSARPPQPAVPADWVG